MSTLTVGQFKTEIRAHFGNRTDLDARLGIVLDLAQMTIARLKDFDELRALTSINTAVTADAAADKIISIATLGTYRKIYSIRLFASNAMDRKLVKMTQARFDKVIPKAEYYARGTPQCYTKWGTSQIELWRVPDAVYALWFRYSVWPPASGADGTTLLLDKKDDAIIHLSSSYLARTLGDVTKARELYALYREAIEAALLEEVEDFDTHMAVHGQDIENMTSRGYDDPFVQHMPE